MTEIASLDLANKGNFFGLGIRSSKSFIFCPLLIITRIIDCKAVTRLSEWRQLLSQVTVTSLCKLNKILLNGYNVTVTETINF